MYYPIQIKNLPDNVRYSEEIVSAYREFVICLWEMRSLSGEVKTVEDVIVTDACIDLVASFDEKIIGFVGMSKTNFHFKINLPTNFLGARFKPGAFHALTDIPANEVMDSFLPVNVIDKNFDVDKFFALPFDDAKMLFKNYIGAFIKNKKANAFVMLIDKLYENIPDSADEVYRKMCYSPRQCQRLFAKNYGMSPQMILCVLRFQKCLSFLMSGNITPKNVMEQSNYYDQAHFINDFKRHIGLTPFELLRKHA